jgi:hypothetical protein
MYAYLLPFQHDINIILLPYKKTSQKSQKTYYYQWRKYQKMTKIALLGVGIFRGNQKRTAFRADAAPSVNAH